MSVVYPSVQFRGDSAWNNKVKTKLREEITLADKENGFALADIDSKSVSVCKCIVSINALFQRPSNATLSPVSV